MPAPETPDTPPPEVPEEFAAAYREAYRRALESGSGQPDEDLVAALPDVSREALLHAGSHRSADEHVANGTSGWRSTRWFLPVVVAGAGVALVLAAYALGKALGDGDEGPDAAQPSAGRTSQGPSSGPEDPPEAAPSVAPGGWGGAVTPVSVDAVSTDCTAPPSRDSAGRTVTYVPTNTNDQKPDTAWRCAGTAIGERLTLRMGAPAAVAEVGLVPGYAKTDPASGVDRYAENNRITRVRWTLDDGVSVVQRLDPDPSSRTLQRIRVPRTSTDTVTLEILAVKRGPRNTTAISEIALSAAG
jgi:hypothetical protein